jgi:hypothetical protein
VSFIPAIGSIAFRTFGFTQTEEALLAMERAAFDAIPFWREEVIPDMERVERQVFMSQGRRGGGSWKFLSPETVRTKASQGLDPRINIATGALLESVTHYHDVNAIREVTPARIKFGTYAPGGEQSQKHRIFLRWTHYDVARWARWWAAYVVRHGRHAASRTGVKD